MFEGETMPGFVLQKYATPADGPARRAGGKAALFASAWLAGLLSLCALAAGGGPLPPAPRQEAGPRLLWIEARDTAPGGHPSFERGADRSYTVSTGGAGDRDERPAAPGNGYVLGAGSGHWSVRAREGEPLRVDLPSVQSLQFHLGGGTPPGAASKAGRSAAPAPAAGQMAAGGPQGSPPSVSGVVYFEAVSAFAASFHLQGARVFVQLTPLRVGGVEAPWVGAAPHASGPLVIEGRVGEWLALGDPEVPPMRGLSPIAEPPSPASVWVRVLPLDEAGATRSAPARAGNATVVQTGQRP